MARNHTWAGLPAGPRRGKNATTRVDAEPEDEMRPAIRAAAFLTVAASSLLIGGLAMSDPAAAFHVERSPDFPLCSVWFNEQGKPLRNKFGREIAQEVPCPGQQGGRERYKAYAGATANTLVIRDETHHAECALSLAPGSTTVMVQTVCQALAR